MNAQIVTLMSTLITGGCVVVPSHFNPNLFWPQVREFHCTWFALVPTIVTQLLECTKLTPAQISRLRDHVRFARSSSAPLSRTANEHFEQQFGLPMIEAMGMTEAGGAIFSNPLPPHPRKVGSPGIPYGFEVRVNDPDGNPLPRGKEGEILIKGESVMKRYHKQPAGAAALVEGFLSTGDLGWQDEDGFIFIAGRKSEMINKGGEKFTPREVEELLLKQSSVIEAAVVGVPDPNLGQDAVAFVVLRGDDAEGSLRELSEVCETQLGSVKSPGHFVVLPELPKGTAHKIDRKKLREYWAAGQAPAAVSTSALRRAGSDQTVPTETIVLQAMAEVLSYPEIAPTDNFFDLGGYSLRGLQLINKLSRSFGMHIPVSALFQGPTAEKLSAFIENLLSGIDSAQSQKSSIASMVPIKSGGSRKPLFLTPGGNGSDEEFLVYARLASYFGADQPLYGLKARSSMTGVTPHATVEEMAKDYLQEVRQIQPQGPYYLLGECTGGVIAFEMARQLRRMGQTVALLVLLDAQAPDRLHYTWRRLCWFSSSVTRKISGLLGGSDSAGATQASQNVVVEDLDRNRRERDAKWVAYKRPLLQYCPEQYDGKLVLLYSREYYAKGVPATWRSVRTSETQILTVEGDHYEYIRECAKTTAATIVGLIDTASDGVPVPAPACQLTT
jgi:thioesterase domain-containing protein/acyl carrier protein